MDQDDIETTFVAPQVIANEDEEGVDVVRHRKRPHAGL